MKITNVNYSNENSGASIAVKRINKVLNKNYFKSEILVYKKNHETLIDRYLINFNQKIRFILINIFKKILKHFFKINFEYSTNFNLIPTKFYKKINKLDSDLINLHWIGNEMMSINQISKINKNMIWTLHDMWPYTSVENYLDENEYLKKYVYNIEKNNFFCKYIYKKKIQNFNKIKLVICTSEWQKKMCEKSLVFKDSYKKVVPLPLDFNIWKPRKKLEIKKKYKIASSKKVVLFILSHKYVAKRKGLDFVKNYCENLKSINICLITINCNDLKIDNKNLFNKNFDNIVSIDEMIDLYSISDLLLMPSKIEAFGQTALEAQACNCPVITFKNTGCEDLVEHMKTGYLCEFLNMNDFSKGIEIILKKKFQANTIRETVMKKYSEEVIEIKYKKVLDEIFRL
jgi:glycosyltransferase involved in cell wall biosynthesis